MKKLIVFVPFCLYSSINYDLMSLEELMNMKIYSANKSYEKIEDTSANIIVIEKKEIEKFGYTNLAELLEHIPGLYLFDVGRSVEVGSRGIAASSFSILLNGTPIATDRLPVVEITQRNLFTIPISSIDRIEIVKGPQAVSYGANSILGSINIVTDNLGNDNIFQIGFGNNNQKQYFTKLTSSNENGGFVFNIGFDKSDGIEFNTNEHVSDVYRSIFMDPQANYLNSFNTDYASKNINFIYKYKNLKLDVNRIDLRNSTYIYKPSYLSTPAYIDDTQDQIALTYEDEVNDRLQYKLNYVYSDRNYDFYNTNFLYPNKNYIDNSSETYDKYSHIRKEIDFHFNLKVNEYAKILFGFNKQENKVTSDRLYMNYEYSTSPYLIPDTRYVIYYNSLYYYGGMYNFKQNASDVSFDDRYMKLTIKPSDNLILSAGLRKTKYEDYDVVTKNYLEEVTNVSHVEPLSKNLPEYTLLYHFNRNNTIKYFFSKAHQRSAQSTSYDVYEEIFRRELNYIYHTRYFNFSLAWFNNKSKNLGYQGDSTLKYHFSPYTTGLEASMQYMVNYNFDFAFSHTKQKTRDDTIGSEYLPFSPEKLWKFKATFKENNTRFSLLYTSMSEHYGYLLSSGNRRFISSYGDSKIFTINLNQELSNTQDINFHMSNINDSKNTIAPWGWPLYGVESYPTKRREYIWRYTYRF